MNSPITQGNFKTFFSPPVGAVYTALTPGQKTAIGTSSEGLLNIVGASFDHVSPEQAGMIAQKALELNGLIVGSYVGATWTDKASY